MLELLIYDIDVSVLLICIDVNVSVSDAPCVCCVIATIVMFNGQPIHRPHVYDCNAYGKCEDPSCGYSKGHPEVRKAMKLREKKSKAEAKRKQQQKLAAIAGLAPAQTPQFDAVLQDALAAAGLDR